MPDKLQVTIVGLGLVGASAGLALKRFEDKVTVVGHDKTPSLAAQAKALGAVDRTEWNLINAVSDADRILLALPVSEIRDTLVAIAGELREGCIIVDTADAKAAVMRWAEELLPATAHMVGGHPILVVENLNAEDARADLFEGKLFCLTPAPRTDDAAVRLAADLVEALGARPFFLDPLEHDGMAAAVEHLPQVMAGALLKVTRDSSSWQDMRKLAGSQFYSSTLITSEDARAATSAVTANREQTVRWLGEIIAELDEWRQRLIEGDDEGLGRAFEQALEAGRRWLNAQTRGDWSERPDLPDLPTAGIFMRSLIGFGRFQDKQPDAKKKR
ncbi:MAG: hypothetical protein CVU38_19020 [Chloroflexi bacterium HGW-Chloroflexi-1]|nr:MAG: hypothetical protein CVU38_19020 [Chloroflexi bacterium HGW-Chloroflexi-1]